MKSFAHVLLTSSNARFSLSPSTAIVICLLASLAGNAFAQNPAQDPGAANESRRQFFQTLYDAIERGDRVPLSWRELKSWSAFCVRYPQRTSCDVIQRELRKQAIVGVVIAPDWKRGVRIVGVTPDGPAAQSGIRAGDVLISINGKPIPGYGSEARLESAQQMLRSLDPNFPVRLTIAREGRDENASVTPKLDERVRILSDDGKLIRPGAGLAVGGDAGATDSAMDAIAVALPADDVALMQGLRLDDPDRNAMVADIGPLRPMAVGTDCKGDQDCKFPSRLSEAFRWNGLNLASVDQSLGRYFGTTEGVLVISTGPMLTELQPGDVIRKIDGKAVATPRAVMDALRDKTADMVIEIEFVRDRQLANARVKVLRNKPMTSQVMPPLPATSPTAAQADASPMQPSEKTQGSKTP